MTNYDGTINYFNPGYQNIDTDILNIQTFDAHTMQKIADIFDDDWFVLKLDELRLFYSGSQHVINNASEVGCLGSKTQKYAILFLFITENNNRKLYINLIDTETHQTLPQITLFREDITEPNYLGIANTTPNTKVMVIGQNYKMLLCYTSPYSVGTDEKQMLVSGFRGNTRGDGKNKYAFVSLDGTVAEELDKDKNIIPVFNTGGIPFKAITTHVIIGTNKAYLSIGDVFQALADSASESAKITHDNVDYCRYVSERTNDVNLYFRIYGGSNGV